VGNFIGRGRKGKGVSTGSLRQRSNWRMRRTSSAWLRAVIAAGCSCSCATLLPISVMSIGGGGGSGMRRRIQCLRRPQ